MRHSDVERIITSDGRELERRLFEDHINLRGVGDVGDDVVGVDGVMRTHKRVLERSLVCLFGKITIKRLGYSARGHNSLFPKDAILNLPTDSYSHGLRQLVAEEASKTPFNEVVKLIQRITGVSLPKKTIEMLAYKASVDFDAFYEKCSFQEAAESRLLPILVLTTDGKGIVMRREDLRESTRKKAEETEHKFQKRKSKGEKANSKRMATVASVYAIDKFVRSPEEIVGEMECTATVSRRPRPIQKRVWASIEKTSEKVTTDIFDEALRRDPKKGKKWVCLVDGDPKQLKRIQKIAKQKEIPITIIMDIIHVLEYLWKGARVFHAEADPKTEVWVSDRLLAILKGKAMQVAAGIRRSATRKKIPRAERTAIDKCCNYLLKNKSYLQYHHYLQEGYPIATGIIEGACRHLIKDRMDVTGARWSLKGAEAIVKLRSLRSSEDFENYWKFHEEQEYIRNHELLYLDPTILDRLR